MVGARRSWLLPAVGLLASLLFIGNGCFVNLKASRSSSVVQSRAAGEESLPPLALPPGWKAPEPRPLELTRSDWGLALAGAGFALVLRALSGVLVVGWRPRLVTESSKELKEGKYSLKLFGDFGLADESDSTDGKLPRPSRPLILYEYEASPFCRKVREAITMLDLACEMRPCPGARTGFSDELFELTGRRTVPFLVDPDKEVAMFESDDIINYLFKTYGPGEEAVPWNLKEPFASVTCAFVSLARGMAGAKPAPGVLPENVKRKPLELWGPEGSPFVKLVREKLCSLMLPHVVLTAARGSVRRNQMIAKTGRFQVPLLVDPNTGVELFESPEICDYLEQVYTK